jgi:fructosamine-3-kinase
MRLADLEDRRPVGGGDICDAYRGRWQGRDVFAKTLRDAPPGFFTAEANGLRWLGEAGAPVPEVLAATDELLVLEWVDSGRPTRAAATALGTALAAVHATPAPAFGAGWDGYVGSVPMDNTPRYSRPDEWPAFFAEQRLLPLVRLAADRGSLDDRGRQAVETVCERLPELAGPPEPPALIHGDLWSGNVIWCGGSAGSGTAGEIRLIDPAAHGGHRESDLALLAMFGCPELDTVLAAYQRQYPLAAGWRERVGLHQLHPMLLHAALFGGSYGARVSSLARDQLARLPAS